MEEATRGPTTQNSSPGGPRGLLNGAVNTRNHRNSGGSAADEESLSRSASDSSVTNPTLNHNKQSAPGTPHLNHGWEFFFKYNWCELFTCCDEVNAIIIIPRIFLGNKCLHLLRMKFILLVKRIDGQRKFIKRKYSLNTCCISLDLYEGKDTLIEKTKFFLVKSLFFIRTIFK